MLRSRVRSPSAPPGFVFNRRLANEACHGGVRRTKPDSPKPHTAVETTPWQATPSQTAETTVVATAFSADQRDRSADFFYIVRPKLPMPQNLIKTGRTAGLLSVLLMMIYFRHRRYAVVYFESFASRFGKKVTEAVVTQGLRKSRLWRVGWKPAMNLPQRPVDVGRG